ncbi:MAG TPA: hypothetical protein VNV65_01600 [Candidatus Solibacter sp.]|jgi:photosystem II stability/assembly factor-like uncharacterized protein|nr:hypothetical protein [Candidatus Solibacter sp.]
MNTHDNEGGLDPALTALDDRLQALGLKDLEASVAASWRHVQEHVHERQRLRPTPWRHRFVVALAVAAPVAIVAAFAIVSLGGPRVGPNPVGVPSGAAPSTVPSPAAPTQPVSLSRLAMWGQSGWATEAQTGAVLHSGDGGRTWSPTTVAKSDLTTFLDAQHAWAATYDDTAVNSWTISITKDGGKTWRHGAGINLCCAPIQLLFSDPLHGWALSVPNGIDAPTSIAFVWRTVDGGLTWMDVAASARQILPLGCNRYSMTFENAATGWLIAGRCPSLFLAATHDGGLTWHRQAPPAALPAGVVETWAPTSTSGQSPNIVVSALDANGGPATPAGVLVSADGGLTWAYRSLPEVPLDAGKGEPLADLGRPGDWWFIGRSDPAAPALYHSVDGGRTWVRTATLHTKGLTWLDATDVNHVRIVTDGGKLLYSTDGGKTFAEVDPLTIG